MDIKNKINNTLSNLSKPTRVIVKKQRNISVSKLRRRMIFIKKMVDKNMYIIDESWGILQHLESKSQALDIQFLTYSDN